MALRKEYQDMARAARRLFQENGGAGVEIETIVAAAFPSLTSAQKRNIANAFVSDKGKNFQKARSKRESLMRHIDSLMRQDRKGKPKGANNPIRTVFPISDYYFQKQYNQSKWPMGDSECDMCLAGVKTPTGFQPMAGLILQGDNELTRRHIHHQRRQKDGKILNMREDLQGAWELASPGPAKEELRRELDLLTSDPSIAQALVAKLENLQKEMRRLAHYPNSQES